MQPGSHATLNVLARNPVRLLAGHLRSWSPPSLPFGQVLLYFPSPDIAARTRGHLRQCEHEIKIVIGGNPIEALKVAVQATMDDHILAIRTLETASRLH